jgi:GR25 family glycosyltransferase involved in LPS biosynthesis
VVKNVPYALVLEDDIDFVPSFRQDFERNVRELAEFVASGHEMSRFDIVFLGREPIVQPWFERPFYTPHVKFAGMSWTTHRYALKFVSFWLEFFKVIPFGAWFYWSFWTELMVSALL